MVHFVSRFTCLILLAMVQKMVIHVRCDTLYSMIINVSESGQDSKICFNRGYPCKTLVYALQFLTENRTGYHFPSVLINVTYNQTINDTYNIGPLNIIILHITGNQGVYINFPYSESSLQVVHNYTWAWINLMFASRSFARARPCQYPSVTHFGDTSIQNYVSVLNCTLASVMLEVVNVTNFVINSTEFSSIINNSCPIVCVEYSGNSQTQCVVTISRNMVCQCEVGQVKASVFKISYRDGMKNCVLEITNNTFSNLMRYGFLFIFVQSAILWIKGNLESLTFSENLFINNRLNCIIMPGNSDNILVQGNIFHDNRASIYHKNVLPIYILSTSISLTKITFDQNVFSGNIQLQLTSEYSSSETQFNTTCHFK